MTDFDPAKHKIVAVVTDKDDPEYGQHFHLSLPDLVQEVREIETQILPPEVVDRITALEAREPSREIVSANRIEEKLPDSIAERLTELEEKCLAFASFGSAFDALGRRVKALEDKPEPLMPKQPANDLTAIPQAIGTIVERIEALEDRNDAGADLYEGMANALRMVADLSKMMERNRARADGQHGMVVDELSHLASVMRRAG